MTSIIVTPRATEKAYAQSQLNNTYIFTAPTDANKQEIAAAIEAQFGVTVERIKTLVQNGKAVRFSRGKNKYPGKTTRKDSKKAYVMLKQGDSIQIFDAPVETEEKK